ncbi:MAG: MBL fold metallo-hydrolase [Puniceicoccales bacterium]|nr:MBL fold metallo-hydrolase [Puniceicoccales bacterium]
MRVFKVGQGNFILLTKDDKALVVDCGNCSGLLSNESYTAEIYSAFSKIKCCKIVVTHDHDDHYNGIDSLIKAIKEINQDIPFNVYQNTTNYLNGACLGWHDKNLIEGYLNNFLDDVTFTVIKPDDFSETWLNPDDPHQNNLVLKVTYKNKSILLPGDAGVFLFAHHCINTPNFLNLFSDVVAFVLPHHGSLKNGEQFWFAQLIRNANCMYPLCIISSDPETSHQLPRKEYIDKILGRFGNFSDAISHDISCFNGKNVKTLKTLENIFITSCANSCCYTVIIKDDGDVELFDGSTLLFKGFPFQFDSDCNTM